MSVHTHYVGTIRSCSRQQFMVPYEGPKATFPWTGPIITDRSGQGTGPLV